MRSEWRRGRLESLGRIVTGKTPPTHDSDNFGGSIPFLTPSDFVDGHRRVLPARTLTQKGLSTVKGCLVPKGVAVSCIGWQMGKAVLIDGPTVTNQQINTIVPDEAVVDRSYLFYVLTSIRSKIFELGATSTRTPIVNKTTFASIEITLPPIGYQQSISGILGAIDDRVDLLRQSNSTLESIAQALFKSWFIDFDPVRAKAEGREPEGMDAATAELFPAEFEESALGSVPVGWKPRPIEELAARVGMGPFGSNIKVSTFVESGVPVLNGSCLKGVLLEDGDFSFITEQHAERLAGSLVRAGDIVITHRGTLGQVSLIPDGPLHQTYVLSQSQFFLRASQDATTPEFMTYFLRSDLGQHLLLANVSQVGVPSISRPVTYLKSIRVVAPSALVAKAFADAVAPLHRRIVLGRRQMTSLSQLRDTLLPRLISGKLRLPEVQEQLEFVAA